MKYCPECDLDFPDSDRFCELDGNLLVAADSDAGLKPDSGAGSKAETSLRMIAVAFSGVVIGVILFLIYHAMTREPAKQSSNTRSSNSSLVAQQQSPLLPSVPSPSPGASASPSVEPSPGPSATPSPSPQTERRVELSSSSISTGVNQKTKGSALIIRLNDGGSIEPDEAWQTGEGIWYRRGSVIALLDPKQVKAIEQVTPAIPQPSPSQSPTP